MTNRLPSGDHAILDVRRIEDCCLVPAHPRDRHKERVFRESLGLKRSDSSWLSTQLLEAAHSGEAFQMGTDNWGTQWRIDVSIRRQNKAAVVRTVWIVRTNESMPRFVTCWVL